MIATTTPVIIMPKAELDALINAAAEAAVSKALASIQHQRQIRPDSITQTDAAKLLKKSRPTIAKMIKSGVFRLNKMGNIPMEQIDAVIYAE